MRRDTSIGDGPSKQRGGKRKSKRTSSCEHEAEKPVMSSLSTFERRLNAYTNGLRERLQYLREQELAEVLSKRTVQERMQEIYCGLLSEFGEETCFSRKAASPSPLPPKWSDKPLKSSPDDSSSPGLSQVLAPTVPSSSMSQSSRGSVGAETPPKVRSGTSPHREQPLPPSAFVQSAPWGCKSPTPSPLRQALQEALLVSPAKACAEAIDLNSSTSSSADEKVPARAKHSKEALPTTKVLLPQPLEMFLREELATFQQLGRPANAPFLSDGSDAQASTLESGIRRIKGENKLTPSSEPREFIAWIARLNVFQFMDRHAAEVQSLREDVVHEVARSVCRDIVYSLVMETLFCHQ